MLPLLTNTIGTTLAVPVLTIAQLFGNLSRVYFGYRQISWRPVVLFIIGAVPFSIIGAFSFVSISKDITTRLIGSAIITFVMIKHYKVIKFESNDRIMVIGGSIVGLLSGLVGSAGPIGAVLFFVAKLKSYIIHSK